MGLVHTMRTAQTNLGTTCAVPAVPRRSRQKTSKTTTSRTPSKIAISTTDAKSPSMSRTLYRAPCRAVPCSAPVFRTGLICARLTSGARPCRAGAPSAEPGGGAHQRRRDRRACPGRADEARSIGRSAEWRPDDSSVQAAAAAACRSGRPIGFGSAPSGQPESEPTRPSRAWSWTGMASRMAPSIRRSRSVGLISPRSACSRKIAQMCWSAPSTVRTVITVLTSTPGIPPGMHGRGRGFGPHCGLSYYP